MQITQLVVNNHQANDSIDAGELLAPGVAGDRAALEKMREQVLRNASKVKFTTAALSTFAVAKYARCALEIGLSATVGRLLVRFRCCFVIVAMAFLPLSSVQ